MKGVMGIEQTFAFNIPSLEDWLHRWRRQPDTITIAFDGTEICHEGVDSDGHFNLHYGYTNTAQGIQKKCAGLQFATFGSDGAGISDFTPFAYDGKAATRCYMI
jgi:hypothetical protein